MVGKLLPKVVIKGSVALNTLAMEELLWGMNLLEETVGVTSFVMLWWLPVVGIRFGKNLGGIPESELVDTDGKGERTGRGMGWGGPMLVCDGVPACVVSGVPFLGHLSLVGSTVKFWIWVILNSLQGWASISIGCKGVSYYFLSFFNWGGVRGSLEFLGVGWREMPFPFLPDWFFFPFPVKDVNLPWYWKVWVLRNLSEAASNIFIWMPFASFLGSWSVVVFRCCLFYFWENLSFVSHLHHWLSIEEMGIPLIVWRVVLFGNCIHS